MHATALRRLVEGRGPGLLIVDVDGIIERGDCCHLYMHRTGHWLGLMHDVGAYRWVSNLHRWSRAWCLPNRPLSDRLSVPECQPEIDERRKGIGIRIEDDDAVSETGHEVLTAGALKSVAAMER